MNPNSSKNVCLFQGFLFLQFDSNRCQAAEGTTENEEDFDSRLGKLF